MDSSMKSASRLSMVVAAALLASCHGTGPAGPEGPAGVTRTGGTNARAAP